MAPHLYHFLFVVYRDHLETLTGLDHMTLADQSLVCTQLGMLIEEMVDTPLGQALEIFFQSFRALT